MSKSVMVDSLPELKKPGIKSLSFNSLMLTQWLTSINDNVFRWLVIGIGKDYVDPGDWSNILMAGSAVFLLPYLLLASPAGWLADRFRKVDVIIACKIAEVVVMCLGLFAIITGNLPLLFVAVGLMGAQSALFAPAKVATIPDLVTDKELSAANGLFGLSTVTATIIGMGLGNWLADFCGDFGKENIWASGAVLIGIAVVGTMFSLGIQKTSAANPTAKFPWNAPFQTLKDLKTLFERRDLFVVSLGETFFWSIGMLATLNIDSFAVESGGMFETSKLPLLISLVLGVGVGSVLAGIWSAGRIELGMLHLGAFFISFFSIALLLAPDDFLGHGWQFNAGMIVSCIFLMALGASSGLFDVPLASYLQKKSPAEKRGAILAANNFLIFAGMFANSIIFAALGAKSKDATIDDLPQIAAMELRNDQLLEIDAINSKFKKAIDAYRESNKVEGDSPPGFYAILLGAENPKVTNHAANLQSVDPPELSIKTYLGRRQIAPEKAVLAQLLWTEMATKKESGELGTPDKYFEMFPNEKPLCHSVFHTIGGIKRFTSRQIFAIIGFASVPIFIFVIWRLPLASLRFDAWWIIKVFYRVKVQNEERIPERMGSIVICNRISTLDQWLFLLFSPRRIRMVTFSKPRTGWAEKLLNFWGQIRMTGGPATTQRALATARKALAHGEVLVTFPEEKISTTGRVNGFDAGLKELLDKSPVPLIPAYIDDIWGSIFTYERGRLFWKFPKKIRPQITISFGEPIPRPTSTFETRQAVQHLGAQSMSDASFLAPARQFIRSCKRRKFKTKICDLSEGEVTGGMYLTSCLVLRKLLRKYVLDNDEDKVGVLLPPSKGGAVVNMALALDKRTTVNLNYSASEEIINACIKTAGIKHILTTGQVISKLGLKLDAEVIELESLKDKVSKLDKGIAAMQAFAVPSGMLESALGLGSIQPDDVATIIFTSGSTGTPKGVMLSQRNISSNVEGFQKTVNLSPSDVLLGILPFFHSFGYTVTLWGNAMLDIGAAFHYTPLDGRQIGKLCKKFNGTVLISTPTFLRGYLKRTKPEQFESLELVVTGAEKLAPELADAFEEKFKIRPVEGYGATELSPVVALNVPRNRTINKTDGECKEGSIGKPLPGVAAKVLDLDSGEELGANQAGMLWIKGPNVMKGYYQNADLTNEVIKDGWYNTGDVAVIDEQGFISITGRISRFSKIGGEMVPHIQIEELLAAVIDGEEEAGIQAVVTAVPDEKKGERLIVFHTTIEKSVEELRRGLTEKGLPNLYIPSVDSFMEIPEIPVLGTGKLDLKGLKNLAMEKFGK